MESSKFPQTLNEVSVQLIFGHGAPPSSRTDLKVQVYASALPPFILGVPSQQVQLYMSEKYLNETEDDWMIAKQVSNSMPKDRERDEDSVLPPGYHGYFMEICGRAQVGHEQLPECSLRFVSGQGYGTSQVDCTNVKCGVKGEESLRFARMGRNATVLTVLDICGNPHATACLSNKIPQGKEVLKWNKKKAFDNLSFPLACAKSSTSYCARVGWIGQHDATSDHPNYKPDEDGGELSELLCFPVANCILAAIKQRYGDDGAEETRCLDEIFHEKFQQCNTRYLHNRPKPPPRTHSDLSRLQQLIDNGIFPVNHAAFNCLLYRREREWFLTRELALVLDPHPPNGDDAADVASSIVDFVVDTIFEWYRVDPDGRYWKLVLAPNYREYCNWETCKAWQALKQMMGWFRFRLLDCFFFIDDKAIIHCGDDEDDANVSLEDLALCYPDLPRVVEQVQNWIATGIKIGDSESSDDDSGDASTCSPAAPAAVSAASSFSSTD